MQIPSPSGRPIYVTRPYLPPLDDVIPYINQIWDSRVLTNCGPLHSVLEERIASYLGVPYVSLFANATLALVVALKVLRLTGEVITPAYSFIATSQAISWNNLVPVFADIRPSDYCLDPYSVVDCITPRTSAILAVQCYGNPGPIEDLEKISRDYNLRIIYDGAHSFGVKGHFGSALGCGDLSVVSFHATKVFNTFEGGAIICNDISTKIKIDRLKNFGFVSEEIVASNGLNAKMSELNAAIGLAQLNYIDTAIHLRKEIANKYNDELKDISGLELPAFFSSVSRHNYAYFPVRVTELARITRDQLYFLLKEESIFARRYFYPLITDFQYYKGFASCSSSLHNSTTIAGQVLCLPIYPDLSNEDQNRVISAIQKLLS